MARLLGKTKPKVFRAPVKPRDKPIYKSDVYDVFDLIYDREGKFIRHFYACKECDDIYHVNYNNCGNSQLKSHKCYKNYISRKKEEEQGGAPVSMSNKNVAPGPRVTSRQGIALVNLLRKVSKICAEEQRSLHKSDLKKFLPQTWSKHDWQEFWLDLKYVVRSPVGNTVARPPANESSSEEEVVTDLDLYLYDYMTER